MSYAPKIAYITGATSGFGEKIAELFAAAVPDIKLILTGRREERLKELQQRLNVPTHILVQDITDTDKVAADIAGLPQEFQAIDLLINNAGLALGTAPLHEKDVADSLTMIDTNIKGLVTTTHAILPGMVARKRGHIINIGSSAGNYPYPGGNVYAATKAFANHFSIALRADVKGKNVRVTSIEPGAVETEFSLVRFAGDKEKADKVYSGYRKITADHIGKTVVWIATQPEEYNINSIEVMPTDQSFNAFSFDGA
jgi:3-hydroxy acid dehydrogenase/malonic semialdehyde reductase